MSREGGYAFSGSLAIGSLEPVASAAPLVDRSGNQLTAETCPVDPTVDAVVPVELTLTNDTPGFPAQAGVYLLKGQIENLGGTPDFHSYTDALDLATEVLYSDGATCQNQSVFGVLSSRQLAPGMSSVIEMFVVLSGYISPAHPSGNPSGFPRVSFCLVGGDDRFRPSHHSRCSLGARSHRLPFMRVCGAGRRGRLGLQRRLAHHRGLRRG